MFKKRAIVLLGTALLAYWSTPLLAATQARPAAQDFQRHRVILRLTRRARLWTCAPALFLDPYLLPVIGAGDVAASEALEGCNGFVGANPNVVVNWTGDAERLALLRLQRFRPGAGGAVARLQLCSQ